MTIGNIEEFRERAKSYYKAHIPCHIINKKGDWINGYVNSIPEDSHFDVLDRVDGSVKIAYIDIEVFTDFTGDFATLPLPIYIKEATA